MSTNKAFPWLIQGKNVVLFIDGKVTTINDSHVTYKQVIEAIKNEQWDKVREVIEPAKAVTAFSKGLVTIVGGVVKWKGEVLHNSLTVRMLSMLREGFNIEPLCLFLENLMQNPSAQSVNELYGFLEKNNLPITPDGHFLAFKRVRGDFKDCYSGTMDNSPGKIVEMPRNKVNDNRNQTCSYGLHFCSIDYLQHFGGDKIVILKINPKDVVSIPSDYNDSKGRCCRYEVLNELVGDPKDAFTAPVQATSNGSVAPKANGPLRDSSGRFIKRA